LLISVGEVHQGNFVYLPIIASGLKAETKPATVYLPIIVK